MKNIRIGLILFIILFAGAILSAASLKGPINGGHNSKDKLYVYSTGGDPAGVARLKVYTEKVAKGAAKYDKKKSGYRVIPDTDFKAKDLSNGTIYLYGPFEQNSVAVKYLRKLPFTITSKKIQFSKYTFSGEEVGMIFIWPQPDMKNYFICYTGTSYNAVNGCNSVFHGPTDYIIYSEIDKKKSTIWDFRLCGYFKHGESNWKIEPSNIVTPDIAEKFFEKKLGLKKKKIDRVVAQIVKIVLKDGRKLSGKLFHGDDNLVIIKEYQTNGKFKGFKEVKFDSIKTVNNSPVVAPRIFKPRIANLIQQSFVEIVANRHVRDIGPSTWFNNSDESIEFDRFISSVPIMDAFDIYGNKMDIKTEMKEGKNYYNHVVRLNYPVRPGEEMIYSTTSFDKDQIKKQKDGGYVFSFSHMPGPTTFHRFCLLVPPGTTRYESIPKPSYIAQTPKGKVLIFENLLGNKERFWLKFTYYLAD